MVAVAERAIQFAAVVVAGVCKMRSSSPTKRSSAFAYPSVYQYTMSTADLVDWIFHYKETKARYYQATATLDDIASQAAQNIKDRL